MQDPYLERKQKAEEIKEKIKDLTLGILIVGSVAYNSKAVTSESDLDLVVILDFPTSDFKELYKKLNQKYESLLVEHAKNQEINNVSIVWDTPNFEVGLHLWDKSAFERVINLTGPNFIFRRENFQRNFKSTADMETLINLEGIQKRIYKNPKQIKGGHVLSFYTFFKDESGFYPGIQLYNLLLDPIILTQKENYISNGIRSFKTKLKQKLNLITNQNKNLYNSLAPRLQNKITADLKKRLQNF